MEACRYPTVAPELCIEILSPSDTPARAKASTSLSWGSQCVWVIDPEKHTAWNVSRDAEPTWISPAGALRVAETAIDLPALFAEVDKKLESPGERD